MHGIPGVIARALFDPMESDQRSNFLVWSHFLRRTGVHFVGKCFLFGRIFCDEPVSTSSENALVASAKCGTEMGSILHTMRHRGATQLWTCRGKRGKRVAAAADRLLRSAQNWNF